MQSLESLQKMNTKKLKEYCRENKIKGYSGLQKKHIIDLILGKYTPMQLQYVINESELDLIEILQTKKLAELKYICKTFGINVYKKTKPNIIQCILSRNNNNNTQQNIKQQQQQQIKKINNSKNMIINAKLYDLDDDDIVIHNNDIIEEDVNFCKFDKLWMETFNICN